MAKVEIVKQDLFDASNPVIGHGANTKGVMGAGIARVFRKLYKDNYIAYLEACNAQSFKPGNVLVVKDGDRLIVNIASQEFPGACAKLELIETGLKKCFEAGITSIALPWIGCGIGGLQREDVLKVLEASPLEYIKVCEVD